jgi:hypothetical protein
MFNHFIYHITLVSSWYDLLAFAHSDKPIDTLLNLLRSMDSTELNSNSCLILGYKSYLRKASTGYDRFKID